MTSFQKMKTFEKNFEIFFSIIATKMDGFFKELNSVLTTEEKYSTFTLKELSTGVVLISNPSQNKGPRLEKILSDHNHKYEFGITFGDKETDEAMHKLMKGDHFYSVVVGANLKHSYASHRLESTEEVHRFMNELIARTDGLTKQKLQTT
jgi:trehalose-6-phosphatase